MLSSLFKPSGAPTRLSLTAAISMLCACNAGPPWYDEAGAYVGVAGNASAEYFDLDSGVTADNPFGVGARAGYRLHPHFAVELDLDYMGQFEAKATGLTQRKERDLDFFGFTINGKGYLSRGLFQPYGIIGIGGLAGERVDNKGTPTNPVLRDSNEFEFVFRGGGGIEFHDVLHGIVEHVPVFFFADVSYWLPTGDLDDYEFLLVSFGLAWKFGGSHGHDESGSGHDEETAGH